MAENLDDVQVGEVPPQAKANRIVLTLIGALVGAAAGFLQLRLLRFGSLGPDQAPLFWIFFLACGVALALVAGVLAGSVFPRKELSYGLAILLPALVFWALVPANVRGLPNVFLLVTDATRADHLSLYGYQRETTPFLRELAGESVVFSSAVSQGTHTIVSTPCILASCYPSEHGIVGYTNVLSSRFTLISEYLRECGYKTYGYATNPHLGPRHGYSQGFDKYEHDPNWAHTPAGLVNEKFLSWVDGQAEGPLFSFLFYIDTHNPYEAPPAYQDLFDPEWEGAPVSDWDPKRGIPQRRTLENLIAQYDGSIAYWDAELRRLVDALKERNQFENAVLIYTSDHGEEFWEHGFWGHNKTIYEPSIHVPLLICYPVPIRFPPLGRTARVVDEVVSSVDLVPTVLEFLHLEPDEAARGRSAHSVAFGGDPGPERIAYCEEILRQYGPYDIRGIRTKTHKYIRILNFEGNPRQEDLFFDLVADPGELNNLLADREEEAAAYREILENRMAEVAGGQPPPVDTVAIGEAAMERLRALGYLGASD